MDFMFEDEVDEVGSDVEAYCPKCKADTTHVVISKYEDEIRRVQCNPCGDVHSFRKPRGEVEDEVPEPIAAKKRAMLKKATWDEFFAKHGEKHTKPYEFRERYTENVIVTHPKFGRGFVSEVMSDSKVEITFKDARRVLVHNRKDMPGLPLAAEGDGIPSNGAKAKAAKNKVAKDERVAAKAAAAKPPSLAPVPASKAPAKASDGPLSKSPKADKTADKTAEKAEKADKKAAQKPVSVVTGRVATPAKVEKANKPAKQAKEKAAAPKKSEKSEKSASVKQAKAKSGKPAKPAAKGTGKAKPAGSKSAKKSR